MYKVFFTALYCPLVVRIVHLPTLVWRLFSVAIFLFFSLLCAGWKHHEVSSTLWKCHLNNWTEQCNGWERGKEPNKWNKEGYQMGPFHMQFQLYNCPVTISKKPWQQTSANFRKMSEIDHFTLPLGLCLKLCVRNL